MSDNDLSGMIARIEDLEQRYENDQLALQSMAKMLEEMKAERDAAKADAARWCSAYSKDLARVQAERESWKASAMIMQADRTYA
jgi:Tfp pilus assembly protein PilV